MRRKDSIIREQNSAVHKQGRELRRKEEKKEKKRRMIVIEETLVDNKQLFE